MCILSFACIDFDRVHAIAAVWAKCYNCCVTYSIKFCTTFVFAVKLHAVGKLLTLLVNLGVEFYYFITIALLHDCLIIKLTLPLLEKLLLFIIGHDYTKRRVSPSVCCNPSVIRSGKN